MSCNTNIICLLWKGDFRGRDYKDIDVWRLSETVSKHIDRPFTMYCLTNDMEADVPAKKLELFHNWPGWWSKIELFRPDLPCGRTLYLDLDTHVVSSLQPILDYEGDLAVFPSPYRKGRYQTSTMLFTPGSLYWVYDTFRKDPDKWINKYRSEQDMYGDWLPDQPTFPAEWLMKISKLRNNKLNKETIIVTGRPKGENFRNPSFAQWLEKEAR